MNAALQVEGLSADSSLWIAILELWRWMMKRSFQWRGAQLHRHRHDDESDRERLQNRAQCRVLARKFGSQAWRREEEEGSDTSTGSRRTRVTCH